MLRLGLMGGTFDPLHSAHLMLAEEARVACGLDKVLFVPAGRPPHKTNSIVSDAEHRYAMTLLGTASNPHFEVSRVDMDRDEPSYSVDTLTHLKSAYGGKAEFFFIIGADEALDLLTWHNAEMLPSLTRFVVAARPGFDLHILENRLPERFMSAVDMLRFSVVEISATDIRNRVATGKSIRYLVPESVEAYIRKHRLYAEESCR